MPYIVSHESSDAVSHSVRLFGSALAAEGATITLTVKETGTVFQGVRMKADPRIIQLQASFLREAGIVSQKMNIEMIDENTGNGNANWDWSDGLMICGGNYTFTLKREK